MDHNQIQCKTGFPFVYQKSSQYIETEYSLPDGRTGVFPGADEMAESVNIRNFVFDVLIAIAFSVLVAASITKLRNRGKLAEAGIAV